MLEDSITSSPSKSNKSIHETRLLRRNKRKKLDDTMPPNNDNVHGADFHKFLENFYKNSDDESIEEEYKDSVVGKPSVIINNYKPFELERSLALADHVVLQPIESSNTGFFPEIRQFISCINLTEIKKGNLQTKDLSDNVNQNSSFTITESELINCCHQAEEVLQCNTRHKCNSETSRPRELTPNKIDNMFLVNSILEDFSQSPLRNEAITMSTRWQHTPEFRLRRQPIKTYSRKSLNTTKINLNERFRAYNIENSEDDNNSVSSSLSMQEDITAGEILSNNSSTLANNTQHLCENLLNLSAYFTENQTQISISDTSQFENRQNPNNLLALPSSQEGKLLLDNIPDLIQDILKLRSVSSSKIRYGLYNSMEDFYGFSNCSENDYPTVNAWKENDCHDVFDCINTEDILLQKNVNNALDCEEISAPQSPKSKEESAVSEIKKQNYDPSNCNGFKTASSNPIKVSRDAHIMTAKILSKLPAIPVLQETQLNKCDNKKIIKKDEDVNIFENLNDYEWNDDCDLFLNIQTPMPSNNKSKEDTELKVKQQEKLIPELQQDFPTTSKLGTLGFQTAGGKNVHISKKAQESVKDLLREFEGEHSHKYNCEEELKEMKHKVYVKTHNMQSKLSDNKQCDKRIYNANTQKEFEKNKELDLQTMEPTLRNLTHNLDENINCNPINNFELTENNRGFQTALGKKIIISAKAQKTVETLLNEFVDNTTDDFSSDLISIKTNINMKNYKHKTLQNNVNELENRHLNNVENFSDMILSEWPLAEQDGFEKLEDEMENVKKNLNMGFQTANGKTVSISAKAQQTVQKLLQEFNTNLDIEKYKNDLVELKTKIQTKNKEFKQHDTTTTNVKSSQESNESANMIFSEWPISPKVVIEQNQTTKPVNVKRKYSLNNSDLVTAGAGATPPAKLLKQGLHTPKLSNAEQSLKSPLSLPAHPVIARRNLLSLTKIRINKRKSLGHRTEEIPKINKELYNLNAATPSKSAITIGEALQTQATPNSKEFFSNTPFTSTPLAATTSKSVQILNETDFKPINWKNNDSINNKFSDNSNHSTKLSDNSASNITLNSSNPTAKERIERLKMYGKAPSVSPVLIETHHNCRPSGLRRTRSMHKRTDK